MAQVNLRVVSRLLAAIVTAVGMVISRLTHVPMLSSRARRTARMVYSIVSVQRLLLLLLLLLPQRVDAPPSSSSPSVMPELVVRSAIDRSSRAKLPIHNNIIAIERSAPATILYRVQCSAAARAVVCVHNKRRRQLLLLLLLNTILS